MSSSLRVRSPPEGDIHGDKVGDGFPRTRGRNHDIALLVHELDELVAETDPCASDCEI